VNLHCPEKFADWNDFIFVRVAIQHPCQLNLPEIVHAKSLLSLNLALDKTGNSAASMAMLAMTASNSTKVKPFARFGFLNAVIFDGCFIFVQKVVAGGKLNPGHIVC
jgi:hypothetical protein